MDVRAGCPCPNACFFLLSRLRGPDRILAGCPQEYPAPNFLFGLIFHPVGCPGFLAHQNWADPGVLWKKAPRAIRAMRGKTLQTVPFEGISTVLWVHQKLPQSTVSQAFPSNKSYESKTGCSRTPATVLWVPLKKKNLGACAMTTKFLDNQIFTFKILLS